MSRYCSVPDCGRPHNANGYCQAHDRRVRRGQPLDAPVRRKRANGAGRSPCMLSGCYRPAYRDDICQGHYARKVAGKADWHTPLRQVRPTADTTLLPPVRVTKAAEAALQEQARRRGLTRSAWVRLLVENAAKLGPVESRGPA